MSDPIDTVRALTPEAEPSAELLARVRSDLMSTITTEPEAPAALAAAGPRRRPKRRWLLPAVAAAVLATSATAWAVTRGSGSTNTSVMCPADSSNQAWVGINATTGDPIADCGAEWRKLNGSEPPAMVAYGYPDGGGVSVRLASAPAPEGATVLPVGVAVDTQIIQLNEALGDIGHGVTTETCLDEAAARSRVQDELDRFDLDGWQITVRDTKPIGGKPPCAWAVVEGDKATVELLGSERWGGASVVFHRYAVRLQAGLAADCRNLADAEALARRLATSSLMPVAYRGVDVSTVETPSAACTTATVTSGGGMAVTLRGPA